jgi:hypothetical protein
MQGNRQKCTAVMVVDAALMAGMRNDIVGIKARIGVRQLSAAGTRRSAGILELVASTTYSHTYVHALRLYACGTYLSMLILIFVTGPSTPAKKEI